MTPLYNSVGKQVGHDGCLKFGDRRFWSPDSMKFAGRWVSARLPGPEDQMVTFWDGDEATARKYAAHLIADTGFGHFEDAKAAAARTRELRAQVDEARASVVRRQTALLMELLEHPVENRSLGIRAALLGVFDAIKNRLIEGFVKAGQGGAERLGKGKVEVADGVDPRLQIAQRIFELGQFGFGDHMKSPAVDAGDASEAEAGAHRLCGGAK